MSGQAPLLILGGYGSVGSRGARMLRRLQPDLPIVIAGRDLAKADALARELGQAHALGVDIDRADLAIDAEARFSGVLTALRDLSLNTMRFAQRRGIPYVALSDGVFELGPTVAQFVHHSRAAPILLLGHSMGGVPAMAAQHAASGFASIAKIELGLLLDPADPLGPMSVVDMERIGKIGPAPLVLDRSRWRWLGGDTATRRFVGADGVTKKGQAVGLLDVLSLAASGASSLRVDFAEDATATRKAGGAPSNEVVIEIEGIRRDGDERAFRGVLIDREGHVAMSARGIAILVERLLGLSGGEPPGPGLYFPESIISPAAFMERLEALGLVMTEEASAA